MTTDLLTFFQPEESSGMASTFAVQDSDGLATEIWMFSRERVDLSHFAKAPVSSDEDWRNLHQDLQAALKPGGGLLVYARPHNGGVKVQLLRRESPGYIPPKRMLRLTLGGNAQFEDISGNADLTVGDHLLIPVNCDAETQLNALRKDLQGLPSDLESSVLNILRRPSLEWRIERIERTLSMPPATRAEQQRSRVRNGKLLDRLYDLVMRPIPIGPAIAAALLLVAGAVLAYDRVAPRSTPESSQSANDKGISNSPAANPDPAPSQPAERTQRAPDEAHQVLGSLYSALKDSQSKTLQQLFESHFKDHQEDPFNDSSPVIWGIAKLEALRLALLSETDPVLDKADRQAGVKAIYGSVTGKKALTEKDSLNLLAWISCQQFNKAELPKTTSAPKDPLPFNTGHACKDLKPEDAAPGLKALTDWVKNKK